MARGSCLCGAVQYSVVAFEPGYAHCYCKMCQKSSGSAFATYAPAKTCDIDWLGTQPNIRVYRSSDTAERGFCGRCGSNIYFRLIDSNEVEIALGTLEGEPNYYPTASLYAEHKPRWSEDMATLQTFSKGRESSDSMRTED